jgi:hypothetical protein
VAPKHAMSSDCHSMSLTEEGSWRGLTGFFDGGALNGDGAGAGACMLGPRYSSHESASPEIFLDTEVTFTVGVEKPRH